MTLKQILTKSGIKYRSKQISALGLICSAKAKEDGVRFKKVEELHKRGWKYMANDYPDSFSPILEELSVKFFAELKLEGSKK